ncbi:hypothetical protein T492DRAFT_878540, partial [Pavlovales sp. CCMP2436]
GAGGSKLAEPAATESGGFGKPQLPVAGSDGAVTVPASVLPGGAQPDATDSAGSKRQSALPPLLRFLAGDTLRAVAKLLADADLPCFRLACKAFRDHSSPAQERRRTAFLRTRALVVFAWASISGYVLDLPTMLHLTASVGCMHVLEELVDNRQCALAVDACAAAGWKGQLVALGWLRSRGCPWDIDTSHLAAEGGHLEALR